MKEYKQIDLDERKKLYVMVKNGVPMKEIAQELKRAKSSLCLELKRNTKDPSIGYLPDEADIMAKERKAKHGCKMNRHPELKAVVVEQLKDGWSPEVIAGRFRQESSPLGISHEAIYQFIYSNEGKENGLYKYLLKARPRRGLIYGRKPRSSTIPDRTSIHDRPEHIASREEFGHCEGDLTFFY
ncbi:MAG: IS30 family transposase [bacterium]